MSVLPEDTGDARADADALGTRARWSLLTDPDAQGTWSYVSERVMRSLVKRGCQRADAADFCQQAGLRAVESGIPYATPDELLSWCLTVSSRLFIDEFRRTERRRHLAVVPETAGDAEEEALARLAVHEVLGALARLPERDRQALLSERRPVDRADSNRMSIQRYRARARLRHLIGGVIAAWAAGVRRLCRITAGPALLAMGYVVLIAVPYVVPGVGSHGQRKIETVPLVDLARPAAPQVQPAEPKAQITAANPEARAVGSTRRRPVTGPQRTTIQPKGAPQGLYVEERPKEPEDRVLCARKVPIVDEICSPM